MKRHREDDHLQAKERGLGHIPGSQPSEGTSPDDTSVLDFQPLELWDNKALSRSHSVCGVLLQQPQQTNQEHLSSFSNFGMKLIMTSVLPSFFSSFLPSFLPLPLSSFLSSFLPFFNLAHGLKPVYHPGLNKLWEIENFAAKAIEKILEWQAIPIDC